MTSALDTDFAPLYERLGDGVGYGADTALPTDGVVTRGTQTYARAKAAC